MINAGKHIRQAYYDALNGVISVNVYKEDVPEDETGNHVLVRLEGETDEGNNAKFVSNVVVILDICTVGVNSIDPDTVEDIDQEIKDVLNATVNTSLSLVDLQLTKMKIISSSYLAEDDGTKRYYRKIIRYTNRVNQLATS